jgi:arylformamidase
MTLTHTPRRADIDGFYTCQHADEFAINWRAFYESAEQRTDALRARSQHTLDIAYGPHIQQRLDLYVPSGVSQPPVLLFLHGGGFREGDPALYGFLAAPFLERGIAFASVGYRLIPDAYLPATVQDAEDALAWCGAHLAEYGVDPDRIVLSGHSAGGILTAHLSVRQGWLERRGLRSDLIKAAIPISAVYDFRDATPYYVDDAQRAEASPLAIISSPVKYTLVAYGSLERSPQFAHDSEELAATIRARGGSADVLRLEDHDHLHTVDALGNQASELFQAVERVLAGV